MANLLALQCEAVDPETNLMALDLKNQGNVAFGKGNFELAESFFSKVVQFLFPCISLFSKKNYNYCLIDCVFLQQAILLNPSGGLHNLHANRSKCYQLYLIFSPHSFYVYFYDRSLARASLGKWESALEDGEMAEKIKPEWSQVSMSFFSQILFRLS